MYHACRVTLIPEDFRSPSFLFFFSFLSLDFLSDYWLPFPFSRHISMFFVEWNSVQWEKKEKSWQKAISMCPERYCAFGSWSWTKLQGITVHRLLSALFALFKYNRLIHTRGKMLHWWKSDASILWI